MQSVENTTAVNGGENGGENGAFVPKIVAFAATGARMRAPILQALRGFPIPRR